MIERVGPIDVTDGGCAMLIGTVAPVDDAALLDAACIPWVPIALVIALATVAVIGAFVLRRDPRDVVDDDRAMLGEGADPDR